MQDAMIVLSSFPFSIEHRNKMHLLHQWINSISRAGNPHTRHGNELQPQQHSDRNEQTKYYTQNTVILIRVELEAYTKFCTVAFKSPKPKPNAIIQHKHETKP